MIKINLIGHFLLFLPIALSAAVNYGTDLERRALKYTEKAFNIAPDFL